MDLNTFRKSYQRILEKEPDIKKISMDDVDFILIETLLRLTEAMEKKR